MEQEVNLKSLRPVLSKDSGLHELILFSKQQLENMFDSITDPIILVGPDYTIERLNSAAAHLVGAEYRAILGKKCYEMFHRLAQPCEWCPHTEAYHHRKRGSLKIQKKMEGKE